MSVDVSIRTARIDTTSRFSCNVGRASSSSVGGLGGVGIADDGKPLHAENYPEVLSTKRDGNRPKSVSILIQSRLEVRQTDLSKATALNRMSMSCLVHHVCGAGIR